MFVVNWSFEMMPAAPFDFDFSVISLFLFLTISNFSSCADKILSCWYCFQVNDPALRPTGLYCNQLSSDLLKTEADGAQVSKTFLRQNSVGKILNGCLALPLRIFSERPAVGFCPQTTDPIQFQKKLPKGCLAWNCIDWKWASCTHPGIGIGTSSSFIFN